jgi:eukaryotic-like serine/threonine-protein kinase
VSSRQTRAPETRHRRYRFGDFTLDLDGGFLRRGGDEVTLRRKVFDALTYLVERHGRLVTKAELVGAIWPDAAVTDNSLAQCLLEIRRALGDDSQQVIRTVARRGYVFTAAVTTPAAEFLHQTGRETEYSLAPVPPIRGARQSLPEDVPPALWAVVENALEKDPAERHQSVREMVENPPLPERGISETAQDKNLKHVPLNRVSAAALIVLLVAAGITVIVFRAARSGRVNASAALDYTQLTNFTDSAFSPALSPDGRMLAFVRGENIATLGGEGDIFIKLLPGGEPVQLTHDRKSKMTPVFTPGGDRIVYTVRSLMTDPMGWSTWTVSAFGGEPKLLLSNASALTWIPGASPPRVLFSQVDTGIHMLILTSAENRTEGRTVYSPVGGMAHRSFLSPDRKHVLVVEMAGGWQPCRLVPFEPAGQTESSPGAGKLVGPSPGQCSSAAWSPDGSHMYLSVNVGSGYHIWRQRFPNGAPEQVTFGATEEQEIAFDPDGRSFLTSVSTRQSTLWIHDMRGERQITSEGYAMLPRFSPDGKTLYFLLRSRANRRYVSGELWTANLETGQRERLLPDFVLEDYSISPDGNRILFVAIADNGDTRVWLAGVDGRTAPRRLSTMDAHRAFFGADGDVFFSAAGYGGRRFMYRLRGDGGGLQKAVPDPIGDVYDVSPDGKALAAWPKSAVQVFPTDGGSPINVSTICAAAGGENRGTTPPCVSWSPNGKFLYLNDRIAGQVYALPIPRGRNIPQLPVDGIASAKQAAALPGARVIHERYAFGGADPSVYAFFRMTTQSNIYRLRVP